jgi:hypothetical protein
LLDTLTTNKTMGNLETLLQESYKFIRMADDLHAITQYINEMRMCFIAITISVYVALIVYAIAWCFQRNSVDARRQRQSRRDMELGYPSGSTMGNPQEWKEPLSSTPQPPSAPPPPQTQTDNSNKGQDASASGQTPTQRANDVGYRYSSNTSRPTASYSRQHTIQSHYHKARGVMDDMECSAVKFDRREQSPVPSAFPERAADPPPPLTIAGGGSSGRLQTQQRHHQQLRENSNAGDAQQQSIDHKLSLETPPRI